MTPLDPTTGSGERLLWITVIEQALKDLVFGSAVGVEPEPPPPVVAVEPPPVETGPGTRGGRPRGKGVKPAYDADLEAASAWIFKRRHRGDFEMVCGFAGVEPWRVKRRARDILLGVKPL